MFQWSKGSDKYSYVRVQEEMREEDEGDEGKIHGGYR